jgi:hypothetical protein
MTTEIIAIADIRRDGGTQMRVELDDDHAETCADVLRGDGRYSDPIVVFYDGTNYWLGDGFHRVAGCERAGVPNITADVRSGTVDDAIWFALGANPHTGLRRTRADIQRAIERALTKFPAKSDREIAKQIGGTCAHTTVARRRAEMSASGASHQIGPRTVERNGTTYTMNTSSIGKREPREFIDNPATWSRPGLAGPAIPPARPATEEEVFGDVDEDASDVVDSAGITPSDDYSDETEKRGSYGDLDEGADSTRVIELCKQFEATIGRELSRRPLSSYRNELYRRGAEGALVRLAGSLAEIVKPKAPTLGVIRGGK